MEPEEALNIQARDSGILTKLEKGGSELVQQVNVLASKTEGPEFHSWDPHAGRGELTPASCPLPPTCALWYMHGHVCTHQCTCKCTPNW